MLSRLPLILSLILLGSSVLPADDYTLSATDEKAEGVSDAVAAQLSDSGVALTGPKRAYGSLWLVKSAEIPADFEATASIKYPFTPGQLIGVLVVPKRADFTDFRGNELEKGTYTLRYGRQPVDGNHIGTSDLADFLVAIPADDDEDPAVIADVEKLGMMSAVASGTTHPAILSLQPVKEPHDEPTLSHDEEREFWILQLNASAKRGDKSEQLPVRMVIVGVSEG